MRRIDPQLVQTVADQVLVKGLDVEAEDAQPLIPEFPESAWRGLFKAYRNLVAPTTEAPDVYHFFCFAVAFGSTLGRRLYVYQAVPIFPNWFVALVGRTGLARKDTARRRASDLMLALNAEDLGRDQPRFVTLPGIGSAEGLLDRMAGTGKIVVAQEAELLSLMSKARRDGTSNLIPHLTTLFDCPDLHTLPTRVNPVTCKKTFLSLLTGTTPAWLKKSLTEEDAYGGFANRFVYVVGDPKDPIPNPEKVDSERWAALTTQMNQIRKWAQEGQETDGEQGIEPTSAAIERFGQWYVPYYRRCSGDGLLCALAVRFQGFAWKLALLYAAQEFSKRIEAEHISPALEVVDWLWDSNQAAFVEFVRHGRGLEQDILDRLTQKGPMTKRLLYKSLHVSAGQLERALEPLSYMGMVQPCDIQRKDGRLTQGYRLIS